MTQKEIPAVLSDTTGCVDTEVLNIRESNQYSGWVVTANKCRRTWRERVEEEGFSINTISATGNDVNIHVRKGNLE